MEKDIFRRVQQKLDQWSLGFPATDSGVEIKLLKKLFSEEDAGIFLSLTNKLETPEQIAGRVNMPIDQLAEKLSDMADRGLLFDREKGDTVRYAAIPFMVGLFEYAINTIDREMADLFKQYEEEAFGSSVNNAQPYVLRTIPVQSSIEDEPVIAPYEDACEILKAIVKRGEKLSVAPCICRKKQALIDEGCNKPLEVCFQAGAAAEYYQRHGMARFIEIDEALKILAEAQEAGLVTQVVVTERANAMCLCCGDCCAVLHPLTKVPQPAKVVFSNYFAVVEKDECTGCQDCLDRCHMSAISVDADELAEIDLDRCIGCGLCVSTCPTEALHLKVKSENQRMVPLTDGQEWMEILLKQRGL